MNISVVIPLYNKAEHISRAVNSVLNQTEQPNEIIIINDGSTDNSYDIATNYVEEFPEIKLFSQENRGVSYTRNLGVEISTSDFIAFLDADDEWKPDYLLHIQRLNNNFPDCGAYATSYQKTNQDLNMKPLIEKHLPPPPWIGIIPNFFLIVQDVLPFCSSSIIIPKIKFEELKGFPVGVRRGEDKMFWIKLALKYPIAYNPSKQVIYHTEAMNRACDSYIDEGEKPHCTMINEMRINNEIPFSLLEDVLDYYAFEQLVQAKEIIKGGEIRTARKLLRKVKSKKYDFKRNWLYALSFIPPRLFKILFILKARSRKLF